MVLVYHPYPLRQPVTRRTGRKTVIALIVALGLPMAVGVGYTVDAVRGFAVQARLSQAVDAAALAGGRVMFDEQRDGHIRTFFESSFPDGFLGSNVGPLAISEDPRAGTLKVSGRATVKTLFMRLLGGGDVTVEAESVVHCNGLPRPSKGA